MSIARRIDWNEDAIRILTAANRAGLTQREIAATLGVSEELIWRKCRSFDRGVRTRAGTVRRPADAEVHIARLRSILPAEPKPATPTKPECVAAALGIRARRGLGGVSVPHLTSVYGSYVEPTLDTPSPSSGENHV
ncbi:hypothetical protein ACUSIJ_28895 [Pseudochelatococcus sp. B33]